MDIKEVKRRRGEREGYFLSLYFYDNLDPDTQHVNALRTMAKWKFNECKK